MKRMIAVILLAALGAFNVVTAMAESPPAVPPLPPDFQSIKISKPDPAVNADLNLLLGEWEGVWTARPRPGAMPMQVRRAKMIVYEVTPAKVKYLWGVGFNPETKAEGKWDRHESEFKERRGKKIFSHEGPYGPRMETRATEFFLEDGALMGAVGAASIEMKRMK